MFYESNDYLENIPLSQVYLYNKVFFIIIEILDGFFSGFGQKKTTALKVTFNILGSLIISD